MERFLPPLDYLRFFEVAARHLSFKCAAAELNVTPAAVGQRIRQLETRLGLALFLRGTRQISLTVEGEVLLESVAMGLHHFREGLSKLQFENRNSILSVSATNSFAEMVLLPALPVFRKQVPDCDVRIIASDALLDPARFEVDVCIRFGRGVYSGCESRLLGGEKYIPVCAPMLIVGKDNLEGLEGLPLIESIWSVEQAFAPTWRAWFGQHELDVPRGEPRINVSGEGHAIRAAVAGQGVVLANASLVEGEIYRGTLVPLLSNDRGIISSFRHYLVWRPDEKSMLVQAFLKWATACFVIENS